MARVCELTGKRVMSGNNVSHAHNKTKRRFLPNLHKATLLSESLGETFSFRIAASTLRTVEHNQGLDNFLAKAKAEELSPKARKIKKRIAAKRAEASA